MFFAQTKLVMRLLPRVAPAIMVVAGLIGIIESRPAFAQPAKSVWDGVYTDEQATRGKDTYQKHCVECHRDSLLGDGLLPALAGNAFTTRWQNGAVGELFELVQSTMPIFQPQSLSNDAYADVVAYVLKVNKYPAGRQSLVGDTGPLKQISFRKR